MFKFIKLILPFAMFIYMHAVAQVWPGPHPLLSPWFKIKAETRVASQVDTFDNQFGYYGGEASLQVPVYKGKDWLTATGNTPMTGITLNGNASWLQPTGGFLPDTMQLLRLRGGINFIYSKGLRNLFMLNVQGIAAHEYDQFSFKGSYVNGSLFWRYRKNDQFAFTLGAAYTSLLGKNQFLPLAGIHWRPAKEDLISLLFPAYFQYTHFFSNAFSLSATANPFSGIYTINYPVNDSITFNDVTFRHREIRAGVRINFKISYQLSVEPEGGWSGGMNLKIPGLEYEASPSAYARIMIRYKFGQRAHVAPILEFDPFDLVNGDPEIPVH